MPWFMSRICVLVLTVRHYPQNLGHANNIRFGGEVFLAIERHMSHNRASDPQVVLLLSGFLSATLRKFPLTSPLS